MATSSPNKFDIAVVVEHYTGSPVPERGGYVKVNCFTGSHEDRTPSATVNRKTGYAHCFACDFSGDAIDLIRLMEGVDYVNALRRAEEITGTSGSSEAPATGGRKPPGRIRDSGAKVGKVAGARRPPRRIVG